MKSNERKYKKCRVLLVSQACIFVLMMILTLVRVRINADGNGPWATTMIQAVWYLCAIIGFALSIPIMKNAVCIKCGKSLLLDSMDSMWNTIPLFQILAGQKPLCSHCKDNEKNSICQASVKRRK